MNDITEMVKEKYKMAQIKEKDVLKDE